MDSSKPYIQRLMLEDFKCGLKTCESACCFTRAFGEENVPEGTFQDWSARICTAAYDVQNLPPSGCPSGLHDDA